MGCWNVFLSAREATLKKQSVVLFHCCAQAGVEQKMVTAWKPEMGHFSPTLLLINNVDPLQLHWLAWHHFTSPLAGLASLY